ncbi:DMT family transporter [Vibrio gazogenes]|uniref:Permease of the drug/metabolite transporter (DMT) superfamily n=1 Tax=Vibrio gazogenes DSM 21264 = NBRC 103151 TaxID=1123492 RepID=A0A1M4Z7X4_VIBGA|nr:DMT family transporter [Vibrio gazogenes]USP12503.1 DMT family transporter [Vibrio gazogenes]SHF13887.1 Permease of the drug/metabolite transporter (DMT) superfamily [Vibrio gazogenes DSM 21264] [Vibrio gazogenes DSM 21264 = NBRC 103151]SJN53947.1 EamA-like transporter family protein [Vibrio gazogenes]
MVISKQKFNLGILLGVIASLIWGSWPVISEIATTHALSPIDITSLRFTIAGAVLLPVLVYQSVSLRLILTKGVFLAIGAGAPYVLLGTYGIELSSSAHFGTIAPSSMLVFSSFGSVLFFKEKLAFSRCMGITAIIVGVTVIGVVNFNRLNPEILLGDLMFVGCGALWASFTLFSKYWQLNSWVATAMVSVVSGVVCAPFTIEVIKNNPIELLIYHGIYQGILVAILALYCYSKSVAILGAARGAIFASLVPPVSLILSYIVLDDLMTTNEIIGSVIICVGMSLALGIIKLNRSGLSIKQSSSI